MDVFDLSAKISLDSQQYEQGLKQAGAGATNFGKLFKRVVGGLAIGAAVKKTFDGVISLTKGAIRAYADYEQLVGGMETLYKDNAKDVIANAERAFETAGMSANEYMQTVTSFSSSLLKSVKGDTEKATQYADMAITDMSDNANKFGTDIESIQNAYRGFAKENYTMLDNLSLGYAGTKTGMKQLLKDAGKIAGKKFKLGNYADMVEAIHVIQQEMGIAGTTAEEASKTISGSFNATKASWENLLIAFGSGKGVKKAMRNLVKNATTLVKNTMPVVKNALVGIGQFVEGIAPVIADELPSLVSEVLPAFLKAGLALGKSFFSSLPGIMNGAWETIKTGINDFGAWLNEQSPTLGAVWDTVTGAAVDAIDGIGTAWDSLKESMGGEITLTGLMDALKNTDWSASIDAFVQNLSGSINTAISGAKEYLTSDAFQALANGIISTLGTALYNISGGTAAKVYTAIGNLLQKIDISGLTDVFTTVGGYIIQGIATGITSVTTGVADTFTAIGGVLSNALSGENIKKLFGSDGALGNVGSMIIDGIITGISSVIDGAANIADAITGLISGIDWNTATETLTTTGIDLVKKLFSDLSKIDLSDVARSIANLLGTALVAVNDAANGIGDAIATWLSGITLDDVVGTIESIAENIWNIFKAALEGFFSGVGIDTTAITKLFEGIETVVNNLISKFTTLIDKATEFFGLNGNVSGETPKPKYSDETVTINDVEVSASELQAAIDAAAKNGTDVEIAGVTMSPEGAEFFLSQITPVGEKAGEQISSDIGSSLDGVDTSGMESKIGNAGKTAGQQVRSNIQSALSSGSFSINVQATVSGVGGAKIVKEARAMNVGRIFRNPTIFGAAQGALQMAGDAGPEAVIGTNSLTHMIREAVAYGMRSYSASAPSAPVSTQPIVLQVNGKTLGRVMAGDNAAAAAGYNKSIAMGYGG